MKEINNIDTALTIFMQDIPTNLTDNLIAIDV